MKVFNIHFFFCQLVTLKFVSVITRDDCQCDAGDATMTSAYCLPVLRQDVWNAVVQEHVVARNELAITVILKKNRKPDMRIGWELK